MGKNPSCPSHRHYSHSYLAEETAASLKVQPESATAVPARLSWFSARFPLSPTPSFNEHCELTPSPLHGQCLPLKAHHYIFVIILLCCNFQRSITYSLHNLPKSMLLLQFIQLVQLIKTSLFGEFMILCCPEFLLYYAVLLSTTMHFPVVSSVT